MSRRYRQPGPNAVIHRAHRKLVGPRTIAAVVTATSQYPSGLHYSFAPQYQTGSRHGQQLALVRKLASELHADRPFPCKAVRP